MRIVIENAGATRGLLLLDRGGQLTLVASIAVEPEDLRLNLALPVERCEDLPLSVVQYVAHTREAVVLGEAIRESRFAADPFIVRKLPKSILCQALVRQGRLTGVLYLENELVAEAFTRSRIDLLTLLCSQAAIAVENAILYEDVRSVTEQLRRSNDALEGEVASRTAQLCTAKERLELELATREQSERARMALQEEVIRAQSERLAELSTPIIPITDRIMVMPLIGTMDKARAQQALETALHEVEAKQAQVVILDITGVRLIGADVANTLLKTAGALRLLGAEAVITGIRPDVARTLVTLGIELDTVVTRGSLQNGITYALQRCGGDGRLSPGRGRAAR
jgi:anti-anti-sigma regulatory factor